MSSKCSSNFSRDAYSNWNFTNTPSEIFTPNIVITVQSRWSPVRNWKGTFLSHFGTEKKRFLLISKQKRTFGSQNFEAHSLEAPSFWGPYSGDSFFGDFHFWAFIFWNFAKIKSPRSDASLIVDKHAYSTMIRLILFIVSIFLITINGDDVEDEEDLKRRFSRCNPDAGSVHEFLVETLDEKNASMSRYAGNVLLIINVATFWRKSSFWGIYWKGPFKIGFFKTI